MARPPKTDKTETRQARLSSDFVTKLNLIANALTQIERREVSIAEAADRMLGDPLESKFAWALEQMAKLRKDKQKPKP